MEQAFGVLVARFPPVKKCLNFSLRDKNHIVCFCMKLRNVCIEVGDKYYFYTFKQAEKGKSECEISEWYANSSRESHQHLTSWSSKRGFGTRLSKSFAAGTCLAQE